MLPFCSQDLVVQFTYKTQSCNLSVRTESAVLTAVEMKSCVQVVINNAGVYGPKGLTLDSVKSEDMAFTFQTNAIGPLLVVQQLLRHKLIGKPGSIIGNVTSKVTCSLLPDLCLHLAFGLGQAVSVQMLAVAVVEVSCIGHVATVVCCRFKTAVATVHASFEHALKP